MFNLDGFISEYVTKRPESMFLGDIRDNAAKLTDNISGKSVLVIGGAGSIGSSFIKAILPFRPEALVVVDTNENGLAELTRDLRSAKGTYVPADYVPYPMDFSSPVFEKMFRNRGEYTQFYIEGHHEPIVQPEVFDRVGEMIRNGELDSRHWRFKCQEG